MMRALLLIITVLCWRSYALRTSKFLGGLALSNIKYLKPKAVLFAGKKKKKKVLRGSGAESKDKSAPQRVSSDMNVSVRKQIQYAKAYKRLVNASTNSKQHVPRVKKPKAPKPEREEYVEIDYENTAPPMLFVDGYNIIGYINSVEGRRVSMDEARDCLVADLCVLASATGWAIECVFDAYDNPMNAGGTRTQQDGIFVYYTSRADTADSYIEGRINDMTGRQTVVATDDMVLRSAAISMGSGFLTASMVCEEFRMAYRGWEIAEEEMEREAKQLRRSVSGKASQEVRASIREMMALEEEREKAKSGVEIFETDKEDINLDDYESQAPSTSSHVSSSSKTTAIALTAANLQEIVQGMKKEGLMEQATAPAATEPVPSGVQRAKSAGARGRKVKRTKAVDITAGNIGEIMMQLQHEEDASKR